MLKKSLGDQVAADMNVIVHSKEHSNLFKYNALTKEAAPDTCCECEKCSDDCKCENCKEDCMSCGSYATASLQSLVDQLTKVSATLDDLGYADSSLSVMEALETVLKEAAVQKLSQTMVEDENDISDKHLQALLELTEKYPEFKRPAKSVLVESPLGDMLGEEGSTEEFALAPTEYELTEAPPSGYAAELPILPRPTKTDAFTDALKDVETKNMAHDIELMKYEPAPDQGETVRPGKPTDDFKLAFKKLDLWMNKQAHESDDELQELIESAEEDHDDPGLSFGPTEDYKVRTGPQEWANFSELPIDRQLELDELAMGREREHGVNLDELNYDDLDKTLDDPFDAQRFEFADGDEDFGDD